MTRGTFQLMKSVNKTLILNKIRMNEPISRAEIAKQTDLTPPTVSSIVKELMDQGIVMESTLGKSTGGRKPKMLHINNDAFYIVGVDAGSNDVDCIITNLAGQILYRTKRNLPENLTNDEFISIVKDCIHTAIESTSVKEKITGIGVAMHGAVDIETGTGLNATNWHLTNIPIKEELEKEFDLDVKVENDARAMALGESWFGNHGKVNNMIVINLGRGVGAGLIVDGKLYHGLHNIAGEVGHMTIDINGLECQCGNRGCLYTFVSGPAIALRANQKLSKENKEIKDLTGEQVYEMAMNGDQAMIDILRETGMFLGIGLTNLIHIINPELILIGGGVSRAHEFILPTVKETIEKRALTPPANKTKIVVTELHDVATLLGAVSLFLDELFLGNNYNF